MPSKPTSACPVCRRKHCTDPTHQPAFREAARKRAVAARQRATYRPYDDEERKRHVAMVKAHVAQYGWWCPGAEGHQAHEVAKGQLEVDHVIAVRDGGRYGPERVVCRAFNRGRKH